MAERETELRFCNYYRIRAEHRFSEIGFGNHQAMRACVRMSTEDFIAVRAITFIVCIVAGLWALSVILCREWVKNDLRERFCSPIKVRWRPFSWRTNRLACAFKAVYSDMHGRIHRGSCWTYWLRPSVTWDADEIIDYDPKADVFSSSDDAREK